MFDTQNHQKAKKYWQMGKIYDWSDAHEHPMTHALHYGSSVFEGLRAYPTDDGPTIFRLSEHVDRLFHSASILDMPIPYSKPEIIEAVKLVVKENELDSAYIRPLAYYSYGGLGLVPSFCPVELVIGAWERGAYFGDQTAHGVSACVLSSRRIHPSQLDTSGKLGGLYVQSVICSIQARASGCDEGIFLNLEGNIAEGTGENIFVVQGNTVKTNDASESILEGITRASILEIARDLGHRITIGPITKGEFLSAEEAFFTGTAAEVTPIVRVKDGSVASDGTEVRTIGLGLAGPITKRLQEAYREAVRGKTKEYVKWLTRVGS